MVNYNLFCDYFIVETPALTYYMVIVAILLLYKNSIKNTIFHIISFYLFWMLFTFILTYKK